MLENWYLKDAISKFATRNFYIIILYFFLRTLILKIRHIFGRWILVRWNKYKEGRKGKKNIFILVKNIESSEYLCITSRKKTWKLFRGVWTKKKMDYVKRLYRKINIFFLFKMICFIILVYCRRLQFFDTRWNR